MKFSRVRHFEWGQSAVCRNLNVYLPHWLLGPPCECFQPKPYHRALVACQGRYPGSGHLGVRWRDDHNGCVDYVIVHELFVFRGFRGEYQYAHFWVILIELRSFESILSEVINYFANHSLTMLIKCNYIHSWSRGGNTTVPKLRPARCSYTTRLTTCTVKLLHYKKQVSLQSKRWLIFRHP